MQIDVRKNEYSKLTKPGPSRFSGMGTALAGVTSHVYLRSARDVEQERMTTRIQMCAIQGVKE